MSEEIFKKVVSHAKEYGFVFPSSEIYDGLGAVYDYGQNGVELKNNLRQYWWKAMVQMHENIVGLDAAIFMHPKTWKASGHIDGFSDPMIDNKDSKKRYRADQLLEDKITKYEKEGKTNKAEELQAALDKVTLDNDLAGFKSLIEQYEIACPISGTRNWTDVRQFNLMFSTEMGAMAEDADKIYLRPETAQGIFVNFLNVQKSGRMKIPFGIAQTGKAFRNEIIARQFIMRMREFEQMEMQFFVRPGTQKQWYEYWKETRIKWHKKLGLGDDNYRFHNHIKMAHYADDAVDIEFNYPFGFKELEGIHSRTDFDLKNHQELSGKKMQYFDADLDENGKPIYDLYVEIYNKEDPYSVVCKSVEKNDYVIILKTGTKKRFKYDEVYKKAHKIYLDRKNEIEEENKIDLSKDIKIEELKAELAKLKEKSKKNNKEEPKIINELE